MRSTPSEEFVTDQGRKLFEFVRSGRGTQWQFFNAIGVRSARTKDRIIDASVAYGKTLTAGTAAAMAESPMSLANILAQVKRYADAKAVPA